MVSEATPQRQTWPAPGFSLSAVPPTPHDTCDEVSVILIGLRMYRVRGVWCQICQSLVSVPCVMCVRGVVLSQRNNGLQKNLVHTHATPTLVSSLDASAL